MSGHSKWATTKHRKGAQDAKRSALFSKLSRNITVAAKLGGDPNPDNNATLAAAVALTAAAARPKYFGRAEFTQKNGEDAIALKSVLFSHALGAVPLCAKNSH